MSIFLYVDNSNFWIEGQRLAAAGRTNSRLGPAVDIEWNYDFKRLYDLACPKSSTLSRTAIFGSTTPDSHLIWKYAHSAGFQVFTYQRNVLNKEKQVDTALSALMVKDAYTEMKEGDVAILISGDGDFIPTLHTVRDAGVRVNVMFWSHASRELQEAADEFVDLNPYHEYLTF